MGYTKEFQEHIENFRKNLVATIQRIYETAVSKGLLEILKSDPNFKDEILEVTTLERIQRVLASVPLSIENVTLGTNFRKRIKSTNFIIEKQDGKWVGIWENDNIENQIDLHSLITNLAGLVSEFPSEAATLVAEVILDSIISGEIMLSIFKRSESSTPDRIVLELVPRAIPTKLDDIESILCK